MGRVREIRGPRRHFTHGFWLADDLTLLGRHAETRALFERLLAPRNDVGPLSKQYDPSRPRLPGNFPQAFTHVALANTARNLSRPGGPAEDRARRLARRPDATGDAAPPPLRGAAAALASRAARRPLPQEVIMPPRTGWPA